MPVEKSSTPPEEGCGSVDFLAVLGGLIGGFAKSVLWFERAHGRTSSVVFGVAGGIVGGFLRKTAGPTDGFDLSSMGLIIVGAAALLAVYKLLAQRRPSDRHRRP